MKFKEKCSSGILRVRVKPGYYEHIDEEELKTFERELPRGFLVPYDFKNGTAEYEGPIGVSLEEYLKNPIMKRTFFIIAAKAVAAMESCQKKHFKLNNICVSLENVYINVSTREINFIYLPLKEQTKEGGFKTFFRNFVYAVIPGGDDSEFGLRFFNYINSKERLTFRDVNEYIAREDFQAVRAVRSFKRESRSGRTSEAETSVLGSFSGPEKSQVMFLEDEYEYLSDYPVLKSTRGLLKKEIDKPVFRIGKDRNYADFFIGNNPAVSRNHADIICKAGHYYIKDLNSTNGTFVNNMRLNKEAEVEIRNGDILRFANEEFIFVE